MHKRNIPSSVSTGERLEQALRRSFHSDLINTFTFSFQAFISGRPKHAITIFDSADSCAAGSSVAAVPVKKLKQELVIMISSKIQFPFPH